MRVHSILLVLDRAATRADFRVRRGEFELANLVQAPREPRASVAEVVESLAAAVPFGGPVLVLTDDVFLQTLEVPPKAVAGLDDRALGQALSYEAQQFSGLGAGDAAIAWRREGDGRKFQVAQWDEFEIAMVAGVVERHGAVLVGIAAPAAMAGAAAGGGDAVPAGGEALQRWLSQWAEAASRRDGGPLMLLPRVATASRVRLAVRGGVLLAIVAAACAFDGAARRGEAAAAERDLLAVRAPFDRLQAAEAEVRDLEQRLAALRAEPAPEAAPRTPWSLTAAAAMLEALAAARPDGLIVDSAELGWRRCVVAGRAREPGFVDRFASGLAPRLAPHGYEVSPAGRRPQGASDARVIEFTIELAEASATGTGATSGETR